MTKHFTTEQEAREIMGTNFISRREVANILPAYSLDLAPKQIPFSTEDLHRNAHRLLVPGIEMPFYHLLYACGKQDLFCPCMKDREQVEVVEGLMISGDWLLIGSEAKDGTEYKVPAELTLNSGYEVIRAVDLAYVLLVFHLVQKRKLFPHYVRGVVEGDRTSWIGWDYSEGVIYVNPHAKEPDTATARLFDLLLRRTE